MARDRADHRRLDVVAALGKALGGLPAAWAGAWGVLTFASALIAAPVFVPLEGWMGWAHTALLALTGLTAWAALTRIAVAGGVEGARRIGLGGGGLQFGKVELRIAAGLVLNLLFLGLVAGVLALVSAAVLGAAGLDAQTVLTQDRDAVGPLWRQGVLAVTALAVLSVAALLVIRLSLFAPAGVGRGRIVALNSMGIAHGAFWPLLILWLILAVTAAAAPYAAHAGWIAWPLSRLVTAFVIPWLWAPVAAGAVAAAWRQLEYWSPGEGLG